MGLAVLVALLRGQAVVGRDDVGDHQLTPARVGQADDGAVADPRMLVQHLLDLGRVHVLAAGNDHVVLAADDRHVLIGIPGR